MATFLVCLLVLRCFRFRSIASTFLLFDLIVELYAQGNVILTDHEYTILSLLRSYTLDAKQPDAAAGAGDDAAEGPVRCAVREKYPFSQAAYLTEDSILTDPE